MLDNAVEEDGMAAQREALFAFRQERDSIAAAMFVKLVKHPEAIAAFGERLEERIASGISFTLDTLDTACQFDGSYYVQGTFSWLHSNVPHQIVPLAVQRSNFRVCREALMSVLEPKHAAILCARLKEMKKRHQEVFG